MDRAGWRGAATAVARARMRLDGKVREELSANDDAPPKHT